MDGHIAMDRLFLSSSFRIPVTPARAQSNPRLNAKWPQEIQEFFGELLGSFLLIFIGTGSVASAVTTGAQVGLWQVAVVWGLGVTFAIFVTGPLSGAHLNPAVSVALAMFRKDFSVRKLWYYLIAQLLGGFLAGICVYGVWHPLILSLEVSQNVTRGQPGSEISAMCFGEYFPNPALDLAAQSVTPQLAMGVEAFGTALIVLVIFTLTDRKNENFKTAVSGHLNPYFIGFSVSTAISLFAPLTQGGYNPARDFGPRLAALCLGWGSVAIPGPRNGFWVYIVGPFLGAVAAGLLYRLTIKRTHSASVLPGPSPAT